jgi:hypothetical protein
VARVPPLSGTGAGTRVPADPSNEGASPAGLAGLSRAWPASRPVFARKTADTVRTNTDVLATDPHLALSLDAGVWLVDGELRYDSATAQDVKAKFTGGASFDYSLLALPVGATAAAGSVDLAAHALADTVVLGGVGVGTQVVARVQGLLVVSAWGSFALQWAQQVAAATNTTMRGGSWLRAQKVA